MQIFVELWLLRIEDPDLAARMAAAVEQDPEIARDVLFLSRDDPRMEVLTHPMLLMLARDDRPGLVQIGREVPAAVLPALQLSWEVTPRMELEVVDLDLEMGLPSEVPLAWSSQMPLSEALVPFVPEPGLLMVVSAALLPDQAAMAPLQAAQTERKQRLEPTLGRERRVRRAVDDLLP